jgi:hypothetical protein
LKMDTLSQSRATAAPYLEFLLLSGTPINFQYNTNRKYLAFEPRNASSTQRVSSLYAETRKSKRKRTRSVCVGISSIELHQKHITKSRETAPLKVSLKKNKQEATNVDYYKSVCRNVYLEVKKNLNVQYYAS